MAIRVIKMIHNSSFLHNENILQYACDIILTPDNRILFYNLLSITFNKKSTPSNAKLPFILVGLVSGF